MSKKTCGCEPFQVCRECTIIDVSETSIENDILEFLNSTPGYLATKTGTKGRKKGNTRLKAKIFEGVGKGDIIACLKGRYGEIEVKKPGEKQSGAQKKREVAVKNAHGFYWLVESVDDIKANLKRLRS